MRKRHRPIQFLRPNIDVIHELPKVWPRSTVALVRGQALISRYDEERDDRLSQVHLNCPFAAFSLRISLTEDSPLKILQLPFTGRGMVTGGEYFPPAL